jgi:hypothetical protein
MVVAAKAHAATDIGNSLAKSLIRLQEYRGGVAGGGKSAAARSIELSHLTRAAVLEILGLL